MIGARKIASSTGITIGPDVAIGSTLRGCGDWGVATLRDGTGIDSGLIYGLGTGTRPVMSSNRIFKIVIWLSVRGSIEESCLGF